MFTGERSSARRDEDVLLAVDDLEKPVGREAPHVSGLEPAVARKRLARGVGVIVIPGEDVGALRENLAVVGQAELDEGALYRPCRTGKRPGRFSVRWGNVSVNP